MDASKADLTEDLITRLEKYAVQLKAAEQENNSSKIRRYKRIVTQYEKAIKEIKAGKDVALGELPNPPGFASLVTNPEVPDPNLLAVDEPDENITPQISPVPSPVPQRRAVEAPTLVVENMPTEDDGDSENLLEKLSIRLMKYQGVLQSAENEGAGAKVRRYKRIINQYNDAIKSAKAGKEVDLGELPNPPGLPPLVPPAPSPMPSPEPSPLPVRAHPLPPSGTDTLVPSRTAPPPPPHHRVLSRADKQSIFLQERQKEYREAAINAKRSGQIPEAKEFLKICKGFDRLIAASESGLPVDLTSIPVSLRASDEAEEAFVLVTEKDFATNSDSDVFEMIKNELQEQIKSCMARRAQFKIVGDVANANRFEQFALTFKKDLNKVAVFQSGGQAVPKFHYEHKSFPVVHCMSDISASDLELTIIQAVGLPKSGDTYVGYEFPYPSESPPSGYTPVVKNSDNPTFNFTITFPIDRDNKQCVRTFKRQGQSGVKLEVWAKGGFLRRDVSLGTVLVKLLPLTSDIMIHDAFDLMNGRRPAGGKLEVKIRVREPLVTKKIETITEKWLIID